MIVFADVGMNPISAMTEEWIGASFTPTENQNEEQKAILATSEACVAEIQAADVIVLGVATYNFNIPATLKTWIDNVTRSGKTFQFSANGPEGYAQFLSI
jgi:FMN-dependent NADH-azoreductase